MTESVTQHYQWTKPEVTKSASTWGGFLNTDLDSIDALVFANQQGIVPVGAVTMFAGATAPANWLICDGRSLDTTAYAALFAVLQYAHGGSGANFNLPNLQSRFPHGATVSANNLGQAGGSFSVPIAVGNLPAHAHPIADVAHSHSAYQNAHSHGIATGGHSHGVNDPGHAHAGVVNVSGTPGWYSLAAQPPLLIQTSTSAAGTNISIQAAGNLGGNTDTQQPGVGVNASGTGLSTTQNVGSNTPLSVIPPYVALNFIIRFS